jgi:hypothetical protein
VYTQWRHPIQDSPVWGQKALNVSVANLVTIRFQQHPTKFNSRNHRSPSVYQPPLWYLEGESIFETRWLCQLVRVAKSELPSWLYGCKMMVGTATNAGDKPPLAAKVETASVRSPPSMRNLSTWKTTDDRPTDSID